MFSRYELSDQILCQTDFQKTRIAFDRAEKKNVIVKEFNFTAEKETSFICEVELLKRLDNAYLNPLLNVYEDATKCYFVQSMTYSDNLFEHILTLKYYSEEDAKTYIRQMLTAVAYLHTYNVAHGNLKPENLLYDMDTNSVKLADFGYYNVFPLDKLRYALGFCSPEQLLDKPLAGQQDIYAIGIVSCLLLLGRLPFARDEETNAEFIKQYVAATLDGNFSFGKHNLSANALNFIQNCLLPDSERPCAYELLRHAFLSEKAPVIPLQSTQINLQKYLAKLRLQNGSSVPAGKLVKYAQKLTGYEPPVDRAPNACADDEDEETQAEGEKTVSNQSFGSAAE